MSPPARAPIAVVIAAAVLATTVGCGASAGRTRRRAELAIGGSLAGVLVSSLVIAAAPSTKPESIGVTIGFGGLAIASTIVYGVAFANEPAPAPPAPPPAPPDHRPEAWALTQQAQTAARAGECTTVQNLSAQVAELDPSFHTAVFARDVAIARCLENR